MHYLFEEHQISVSGDHQEAKENLRSRLYTSLYGYESYPWVTGKGNGANADVEDSEPKNFTPPPSARDTGPAVSPAVPALTHKPFVPASNFNPEAAKPFGKVLDAPLG